MFPLRKKILAICGSTRRNSSNENILKGIANAYRTDLEFEFYNDLTNLPYFNPDFVDDLAPQIVKEFYKAIENADGIIFCTPEYVFSLPGVLKNALEWTISTTLFHDKPTAIIVASGQGQKAFESIKIIMNTMSVKMPDDCAILISGARSKFTGEGTPNNESTKNDIEKMIHSFRLTMNA